MTHWTCHTCDPPTTGTGDFYAHWTPAHYVEAPRAIPAQREPATGRASGSGGLVRAALLAEREARLVDAATVNVSLRLSDPRLTIQGPKAPKSAPGGVTSALRGLTTSSGTSREGLLMESTQDFASSAERDARGGVA